MREKRHGVGFETVAGMGAAIVETLIYIHLCWTLIEERLNKATLENDLKQNKQSWLN